MRSDGSRGEMGMRSDGSRGEMAEGRVSEAT